MRIVYDHSKQEAPQIRTFFFKPEQPLEHLAGQFIEISLDHEDADNRGTKRWFTLSSSPNDELVALTTRILPDGSSFKRALESLKKGDELHASEAMGDFVLPLNPSIPLIFVAAGIGITPFHSMAAWMIETNAPKRDIKLLHAVQNEDDIIFQDTFDDAGIHETVIVENPSDAWGGERSRLDANHIVKLTEPATDTLIYLAGSEGFIEKTARDLMGMGIDSQRIITDKFIGYSSL